jgi:hypothetical protein
VEEARPSSKRFIELPSKLDAQQGNRSIRHDIMKNEFIVNKTDFSTNPNLLGKNEKLFVFTTTQLEVSKTHTKANSEALGEIANLPVKESNSQFDLHSVKSLSTEQHVQCSLTFPLCIKDVFSSMEAPSSIEALSDRLTEQVHCQDWNNDNASRLEVIDLYGFYFNSPWNELVLANSFRLLPSILSHCIDLFLHTVFALLQSDFSLCFALLEQAESRKTVSVSQIFFDVPSACRCARFSA